MEIITPSVSTETGVLKVVVLGLPDSLGPQPTLDETYDATSYQSVQKGIYPTESNVKREMDALYNVLTRYNVQVLRPNLIQDYNQIFARDVAFTIENKLFVANMIEDRKRETEAFASIFQKVDPNAIIHLPEGLHVEGGDVLLYGDYLFIGSCQEQDFKRYKTARTNKLAIEYFTSFFPDKKVIPLKLKKHDQDPSKSVLHLDCAFQPISKGRAVVYPNAFVDNEEYQLLESIFGTENLFKVTDQEAQALTTNFVSLSPDTVITEERFERLNSFLCQEWGMKVETVPYHEISKEGGLLRCSTCPLLRE
ncbi:dimethylarginine dimethylaminohydrolase family protein [Porphyromonas circumdentaria]|uniref:arginine deiminase n=1 Tax=Porphyromonas circumdentaria TaxID=29524 RepID=A0A1T4N0M8_9PORP|nr:arginine deiminase family protein [Porphyromonas circumdentaria]MBB6276004.1 N-dimethylarginine dimethylaminohydrolase [Porphyromonas circumdentaria]MDO4721935.1 arginine deiminase family protein [Porphyromonas circumdentaria]SJZ72681.1 N-Dimethylarginine dimethylaminohydrolase [Porphyromonas circumdentaria]